MSERGESLRSPLSPFPGVVSEREFCHQSNGACVAGEHRPRNVEVCIARRNVRLVRSSDRWEAAHIIHSQAIARIAAGDILWVIDDVGELRPNLYDVLSPNLRSL